MGDGIMAVFGAPNSIGESMSFCAECSHEMLKAVAQLNAAPEASGSPPLKIGIGLHVGMAVMGHVGASDRHDYSAIGDVTNTASRIEGLTKAAGFRLSVREQFSRRLDARKTSIRSGKRQLKGEVTLRFLA